MREAKLFVRVGTELVVGGKGVPETLFLGGSGLQPAGYSPTGFTHFDCQVKQVAPPPPPRSKYG